MTSEHHHREAVGPEGQLEVEARDPRPRGELVDVGAVPRELRRRPEQGGERRQRADEERLGPEPSTTDAEGGGEGGDGWPAG